MPSSHSSSFVPSLTRKITSRASSLLETFLSFDHDSTGLISRSNFASTLHLQFGITLSPEHLNALCSTYGVYGSNGGVKYEDFVEHLIENANDEEMMLTSQDYGSMQDISQDEIDSSPYWNNDTYQKLGITKVPVNENVKNLKEVIARKIRSRTKSGWSTTALFLNADKGSVTSGTGISASDFQSWLFKIGLDVSIEMCVDLLKGYIDGYDHGSGVVSLSSLSKFVDELTPGNDVMPWEKLDVESKVRERMNSKKLMNHVNKVVAKSVGKAVDNALTDKKLLERIGVCLTNKHITFVQAFNKFAHTLDSNTSKSSLSVDDLSSALKTCGLDVGYDRAQELLRNFHGGKGGMKLWEFIRMVSSVNESDGEDSEDEKVAVKPVRDFNKEKRWCAKNAGDYGDFHASKPTQYQYPKPQTSAYVPKMIKQLKIDEIDILTNFKLTLEEEARTLTKTFKLMDKDGTHSLDKSEFKRGLEKLGRSGAGSVSDEMVDEIFERFDRDGSGKLKYFEFVRMLNDF